MVLSTRLKDERMAGRAEGREEGRQEGLATGHAETALELLKDKMPLDKIIKYSQMNEEEIYALATANDLEVVK